MLAINNDFTTQLTRQIAKSWELQDGPLKFEEKAIILVSSMAGITPAPLCSVYGASKAFLISLAQSLRIELRGVCSVHVSCPGMVVAGNTFRWFGPERMRYADVITAQTAAQGILCWVGGYCTVTTTSMIHYICMLLMTWLPSPVTGYMVFLQHRLAVERNRPTG